MNLWSIHTNSIFYMRVSLTFPFSRNVLVSYRLLDNRSAHVAATVICLFLYLLPDPLIPQSSITTLQQSSLSIFPEVHTRAKFVSLTLNEVLVSWWTKHFLEVCAYICSLTMYQRLMFCVTLIFRNGGISFCDSILRQSSGETTSDPVPRLVSVPELETIHRSI